MWDILDELEKMLTDIINNEIVRRSGIYKKVMWIIQASVNRENYFHIPDVKEPKKAWIAAIHSSSSNVRQLKQKLPEEWF